MNRWLYGRFPHWLVDWWIEVSIEVELRVRGWPGVCHWRHRHTCEVRPADWGDYEDPCTRGRVAVVCDWCGVGLSKDACESCAEYFGFFCGPACQAADGAVVNSNL